MQGMSMDINHKSLTNKQLKWLSLRTFNIVIVYCFIFFFAISIALNYPLFDAPSPITTPLFLTIIILLLCVTTLFILYKKNDFLAQRIIPTMSAAITLFITINSYYQEQPTSNSFLYLVLLLPVFYSYLMAYSATHLISNNALLITCYIFFAVMGETATSIVIFNCLFLLTLCYLTIFTPYRHINEAPPLTNQKTKNLNNLIHNIRQPLSSLSLSSHLLEKKVEDPSQQGLVENIKHASQELEQWVLNVFDIYRLDNHLISPKINNFNLISALHSIIQTQQQLAESKGIQLHSHLEDFQVKGDKALISSVIETLLSYAISHNQQLNEPKVVISARQKENKIIVKIYNQYQPINEADLKHIFDQQTQINKPPRSQNKGTDLGLAIAQRKAKLCQTLIKVSSDVQGSCFSLCLQMGKVSTRNTLNNNLFTSTKNEKILLIDDDKSILAALSLLLEGWGYQVECAKTAEEGLQKYKEEYYDLVISDYRLPNQKTGLEVIQKINGETPTVLLTGEADPEKLQKGVGTIIHYKILNKPVKPAALRTLLKQLLN